MSSADQHQFWRFRCNLQTYSQTETDGQMAPQQHSVRVPLRGLDTTPSKRIVTIPEGAILKVIGHPDGDRFVTVRWKERDLLVFTQDLQDRTTRADLPETPNS